MTKGEARIAAILVAVANRKYTVRDLKRTLADGMAYVEQIGVKNAQRELIEELAAVESAIARIEVERVKHDRLKNN